MHTSHGHAHSLARLDAHPSFPAPQTHTPTPLSEPTKFIMATTGLTQEEMNEYLQKKNVNPLFVQVTHLKPCVPYVML